jgi:uncharacterized membrane protein YeaQ/YmgE (transglycosylase-associated protein family)
MHLSDQGLIVILVVGLVAGWLAGKIVRGNGFGLVGDAAIGIVGALIGDWLLPRLGVHFSSGVTGLVINAAIGAIMLLLALRLLGASGWGGHWR